MHVGHDPGHSILWADCLSRSKPETFQLFDPANRIDVDVNVLLGRTDAWTLHPETANWPDHLQTGKSSDRATTLWLKGRLS